MFNSSNSSLSVNELMDDVIIWRQASASHSQKAKFDELARSRHRSPQNFTELLLISQFSREWVKILVNFTFTFFFSALLIHEKRIAHASSYFVIPSAY